MIFKKLIIKGLGSIKIEQKNYIDTKAPIWYLFFPGKLPLPKLGEMREMEVHKIKLIYEEFFLIICWEIKKSNSIDHISNGKLISFVAYLQEIMRRGVSRMINIECQK